VYQERHRQQATHRLATSSRLRRAILTTREDKEQLLVEACQIIREEMGYCFVWLGELLARGEIQAHACECAVNGQRAFMIEARITEAVARIARTSATTQEPLVECLASDPCLGDLAEEVVLAAFAAPLSYSDLLQPTLMLAVGAEQTREMTNAERQALQSLTSDLGLAVDAIAADERSKRAEDALRMSEDRFRHLAEHSLVGIVLIQNDLYRYVNPAFARMFGYDSPHEIIDRLGPLDLTAPESREVVAENVAKRVLGQVRAVRYQYRGLRRDGTRIDVEEHGARTIHARSLAVVATVMDVTARETSRRRLEALSHAGLALALAQTPGQVLEKAAELVAEIWSCASVTIVLCDQGALTVAVQITSENSTAAVGARVAASAAAGDLDFINCLLETPESVLVDGGHPLAPHPITNLPLIVRGELIGFIVIETATDRHPDDEGTQQLQLFADHAAITYQHLHLISNLEEERNRLAIVSRLSHTLSETLLLPDVVERAVKQTSRALNADICLLYLWDSDAQTLVAVAAHGLPDTALSKINARLADQPLIPWTDWMTVHSGEAVPAGMLHSPHWALVPDVNLDTTCTHDRALEARSETIGFISFSRHQSRPFTLADADLIATLSMPIAMAVQNVRFYQWVTHQAELKSEALRRQEELDRMKDELIQNISHELRTPLALVMGYAEMLNTRELGPLQDEQADAIGIIARRSRMLGSLVEDISLLWNTNRSVEAREVVDLRATAEVTVREFTGPAQDGELDLYGEWPEQPVIIVGVPLHIRRMLDNLIGNSLKFTQPGGRIDLKLSVVKGLATLSVTDTGIGVPAEKLDRIFERFYQVDGTTKRRYGGTGLGLALVKSIVEAHSGTVEAESPISDDPERPGTRIVIRLPVVGPGPATLVP
jgi:PAS domain S-box-containing protein